MPPQQPPQPQFSPQQIQEAHGHLSDLQKTFDGLIKLPDSELNMKAIFDACADLVTKYQLSDGKRGAPATTIAAELSSPDFPQGDPPPPKALRQFLQKYFDQFVSAQAKITSKFGAPQQQMPQQGGMQ